MIKKTMALLLCLSLATPMWSVGKRKVKYMAGTFGEIKSGKVGRIAYRDDSMAFMFKDGYVSIPYSGVTVLEYGQQAGRRVGQTIGLALLVGPFALPLLLTKRRRHYLSVGWNDRNGVSQAVVLEIGKSANRGVANTLSASSGVPIDFESDKARENFGK